MRGNEKTVAKKQALCEQVRHGTIRVLLGSTPKMGTGTNVENLLVALHHLDVPWKPDALAEIAPRDTGILSHKNTNEEVAIYRYMTEGSVDAYLWQTLETKARFHAQRKTGDSTVPLP